MAWKLTDQGSASTATSSDIESGTGNTIDSCAGTALANYADEKAFVAMMRSGVRPDGSAISTVMPFGSLKAMSDIDLEALFLYLKSLAPRAAGSR